MNGFLAQPYGYSVLGMEPHDTTDTELPNGNKYIHIRTPYGVDRGNLYRR